MLGAKQTALMYVYKDGKFKTKLRLDKVEKQHSVGFVVDGTMEMPPEQGDQVYVKELNKTLAGKVALSDDKRGVLAVDLRQRDGVKPGMHCEVRRLGQKIGTVLITEVQNWGSWAKPEGDLRIDQVQKGDFVEVIEEKSADQNQQKPEPEALPPSRTDRLFHLRFKALSSRFVQRGRAAPRVSDPCSSQVVFEASVDPLAMVYEPPILSGLLPKPSAMLAGMEEPPPHCQSNRSSAGIPVSHKSPGCSSLSASVQA